MWIRRCGWQPFDVFGVVSLFILMVISLVVRRCYNSVHRFCTLLPVIDVGKVNVRFSRIRL